MAHVIDGLDLSKQIKKSWRYPWNTWLNGKTWVLVAGEDYPPDTKVESIRAGAYQAARSRNKRVHVSILKSGTVIDGIDLPKGGVLLAAADDEE